MLQKSAQPSWGKDLFRLALFFIVYYLVLLGSHGLLDPDEGRYSSVSLYMWQHGEWLSPKVNGVIFLDKPLLTYWLQVIALSVFGLSEWALRLFPALSAIGAALSVYAAGRYCFNRRTGLWASLITATMPLYFAVGHYANMDMEVASFITMSLCWVMMAIKAEGRPKLRRGLMVAAYVFASLAFLTKGMIGLVFPAVILFFWMLWQGQWRFLKKMHLGWGLLIVVLLVGGWLLAEQLEHPWFLHYFFIYQQVDRFLGEHFNQQQPIWFYLGLVFLGGLPWTAYAIQSFGQGLKGCRKEKKRKAFENFALIWFWWVMIFFSIPASKLPGYIVPAFPPLALVIARYWDRCLSEKRYKGLRVGFGFVNLALILMGVVALIAPLVVTSHPEVVSQIETPVVVLGIVALLMGMVGGLWWLQNRYVQAWPWHHVVFMVMAGWGALIIMPGLQVNTAKKIYHLAQWDFDHTPVVATYEVYSQGLPVYVQHPVVVVTDWKGIAKQGESDGWQNKFWIGLQHQPSAHQWLWQPSKFWQKWKTTKMVVVTYPGALSQFKAHDTSYHVLGSYRNRIVVANIVAPEQDKE